MNPNSNISRQSSASAPMPSPPSPPLQRGKACLSCRRRKMKCDGLKPVCTPCLRGERVEDCEYTDGQRRPRTLTLEEDIVRLRARVQELEHPEGVVPSVELHAPYTSAGSSGMRSPSIGPAYHHAGSTRQATPSGTIDPRRISSEADAYARRALSVIAPYSAELGFFLNIDRLRVRGTHVLPALQSALTLWSVHITSTSEPGHGHALERTQTLASNILSQAQVQLTSALSNVDAEPDPTIFLHVIQAGVLLAYYMQRIGQLLGARYHASGTLALVMMLKLHQSPFVNGGGEGSSRGGSSANVCAFAFSGFPKLAPVLDGIEAEERVRAFWAVYALDRWFSAVGQSPCQPLPMDGNGTNAMTVPWPDVGGRDKARNVVQHLLNDPNHDFMRDGPSAMHAKVSVLLGEASTIAAAYVADNTISQSSGFRARFATLDTHLQRCLNAAVSVATQPHSQALVTLHLIAFAQATLHRPFIPSFGPSRRRCAEAAFGVVRVLDRMGEMRLGVWSQSPVYAMVWTSLSHALHDEVLRLRARPDVDPSRRREEGEMVAAIRKLVGVLSALSQGCPNRFFAIKIEAVLPILESIAT